MHVFILFSVVAFVLRPASASRLYLSLKALPDYYCYYYYYYYYYYSSMAPLAHLGPNALPGNGTGTLTAEERNFIAQQTSCNAVVRGRKHWKTADNPIGRMLTVSGSLSGGGGAMLQHAHNLAMEFILKSQDTTSTPRDSASGSGSLPISSRLFMGGTGGMGGMGAMGGMSYTGGMDGMGAMSGMGGMGSMNMQGMSGVNMGGMGYPMNGHFMGSMGGPMMGSQFMGGMGGMDSMGNMEGMGMGGTSGINAMGGMAAGMGGMNAMGGMAAGMGSIPPLSDSSSDESSVKPPNKEKKVKSKKQSQPEPSSSNIFEMD
jgi:hypothetical protein